MEKQVTYKSFTNYIKKIVDNLSKIDNRIIGTIKANLENFKYETQIYNANSYKSKLKKERCNNEYINFLELSSDPQLFLIEKIANKVNYDLKSPADYIFIMQEICEINKVDKPRIRDRNINSFLTWFGMKIREHNYFLDGNYKLLTNSTENIDYQNLPEKILKLLKECHVHIYENGIVQPDFIEARVFSKEEFKLENYKNNS